MERFIGLDVHAASCTLAVVGPSGRRLKTEVVETNGGALVDAVCAVPGTRRLCMEEGTQSQWLYEVLCPHVTELVVAGAGVAHSFAPKSDKRDAYALAEALRIGAIRFRVHKGLGAYKKLRQLVCVHRMIVKDTVRVQLRIKASYRSWGIPTPGKTVFGSGRDNALEHLDAAVRPAMTTLYDELDALVPLRQRARKAVVVESHRHRISHVLETAPGMGPLRVAELVSIIVSPHRFRRARQLWAYSGLGLVMRSSSDYRRDGDGWVWAHTAQPRGLNRNHNAELKNVFKGAATTVIARCRTSPLGRHYDRMVEAGTKPPLAKLTLARKIAAIVLAMWKNEEVYDPTRHHAHT